MPAVPEPPRPAAPAAGDAAAWLARAELATQGGDGEGALEALARACAARSADAALWRRIGHLYAVHWRHAEADAAFDAARRLDPGDHSAAPVAAIVKGELGDTAGALALLAARRERDPGDLGAALGERLMLPQVYDSLGDLARWRARYAKGLASLAAELPAFLPRAGAALDVAHSNFLLAYQGEDDRELQRGYSGLLAALVGAARPELRERPGRRFEGGRRLRVGFVGAIFRDCTAGRYFERWVTGLDAQRFERRVYSLHASDDELARRIAAASDAFTVVPGAREAAERIRADALDVLVHPEVGMHAASYPLAALHLAPVQAAGWGHPVTTGSDAIDWYLTAGEMEPAEAQSHYVERLLRLPGPGVSYARPAAARPVERSELRVAADARVYLCAQSLFKIHPAMDPVFAALLAADPRAALVFFQAPSARVTTTFAERLQRALAARGVAPRGQVKFVPRLAAARFRGALAAADVVLDTLHWSGGNTSLDAFAAGVPVVTAWGRFMRGRQTAAMLRSMGLEGELVADSAEAYVRIAVETARDRDRNAGLREAIVRRAEALFERPEPQAAFAEALLAIAAGKAP